MPTNNRRATKKEAEPQFRKRLRMSIKNTKSKLTNGPGVSKPRLKKLKLNA